jgi:DNA-binding transcriptional ArsR family regulator
MDKVAPLAMDPAQMEARAGEAAAFLASLASRHRLMILCSLLDEELCVGDLLARMPLSQSNLSRHLATLRDEGLVATRRAGTVIYYRIASDKVRPVLTELYRLFCAPGAADGAGA